MAKWAVAMSGGVDSSVAAALLAAEGHEVVGLTMNLWPAWLPEAQIPMTEAAIYIATAPKSNAVVRAIGAATRDVEEQRAGPVPVHLRDSSHPQAVKQLGHGRGYKYAHDHPGGFVPQEYLPDGVAGHIYYDPTEHGFEAEIRRRLRTWWKGVKRYTLE